MITSPYSAWAGCGDTPQKTLATSANAAAFHQVVSLVVTCFIVVMLRLIY